MLQLLIYITEAKSIILLFIMYILQIESSLFVIGYRYKKQATVAQYRYKEELDE